jgi:AcrR family transcriptional regulator
MTAVATLSEVESPYARKTRARILAAAERRFKHYGYAKTTMVDIARDCAMSHANVYRFFRNKGDIVDAIAAGWLAKSEDVCREVARRPISAKRRLTEFILELHRWKKREYARSPRAYELLTMASHEGRPFIGVHLDVLHGILVEIIQAGNARGEFTVRNPGLAAEIVQYATARFCDPRSVARYSDEPLEAQAQDVMRVLLGGLSAA